MENQVLSIEQMQELVDLGIDTSKASMYISEYGEIVSNVKICELDINWTPSFTLQDILEILPIISKQYITVDGITCTCTYTPDLNMCGKYSTLCYNFENYSKKFEGDLLQIAFNMLKWCKQNNYI